MTVYYKMQQIVLQNATDSITKCDRSLWQNESGFLLQNETILLQNATIITKCDAFFTKFYSYYKIWRLLQIATVHMYLQAKKLF